MKNIINSLILSISLLTPVVSIAGGIDQNTVCKATSWKAADNANICKTGQKIAYLPSSFGNEQLPIMFIGLNCDLRYSVSLTNGGAVCVFLPVDKVAE